jgi:hypothetical protein
MPGETDLTKLLENMNPFLHEGDYVFCTVPDLKGIDFNDVIGTFTEEEGITLVMSRTNAVKLNLSYSFVCSWITLTVNSSLEAIGLTAAFSTALSKEGISCNVIAGYHHDHIFVHKSDADRAMKVLSSVAL